MNHVVLFPVDQIIILVIGSLVPLVSYVLNKYLPTTSESVKALVHVVVAAIAGALYTAVDTSVFGFNNVTLQLIVTAVVGALAAHKLLWKPAKINEKLGAVERTTVGE